MNDLMDPTQGEVPKDRHWYAVQTAHQHEKSVSGQLEFRGIEAFLPTYERMKVWRNRQKVTIVSPLFPGYLFVSIEDQERGAVLGIPGAIRLVGSRKGPIRIPDPVIEFLRSNRSAKLEPYLELPIGQRVRVKQGAMREVTGILVRKKNSVRFVVSIDLINQCAALEVDAQDLEVIPAEATQS